MRIGFDFSWRKHDNFALLRGSIMESIDGEYLEVVGIQVFKFFINLHIRRE